MSKLRQQMITLMERENYSAHTIKSYVHAVIGISRHYHRCPSTLSDEEIGQYLSYTRRRGCSWSTVNAIYNGIKWFHTRVLDQPWNHRQLPRPKKEKRLPQVLSRAEVKRLIEAVDNLKHQTALMVMYSAGLRSGEVVRLKPSDIDSDRMLIRIEQGKGKKDRYTLLSASVLIQLRKYWKQYRPNDWLFEGANRKEHWSISSLRHVFNRAVKKAEIHKSVSSHVLRHSFATHLLEQGVDVLTIKELLGHNQFRTTAIYLHVQKANLSKVANPIDQLFR